MSKQDEPMSPLMKQWNEIKRRHPNAILLFGVNGFYEMFGDDAITCSKVLNLTITYRYKAGWALVPITGFAAEDLQNYLPKLIKAGHRVAVCDQLEDPKPMPAKPLPHNLPVKQQQLPERLLLPSERGEQHSTPGIQLGLF